MGTVLKEAVPLIRCHNEMVASTGKGALRIEDMPLGARIVAVADTYDELVTDKPYAAGRAPWVAIKEIEKASGTRFDREVVDALKSVIAHRIDVEQAALSGAGRA